MKFPTDARAVQRKPETDAEIIRRQPVRGMLRRMMRNHLKLVPVWPAQTPFEVIAQWGESLASKPKTKDLNDLAARLRGARLLEEDGAIAGQLIVDALMEQGRLIKDWPHGARLNALAGQLHALLSELGML